MSKPTGYGAPGTVDKAVLEAQTRLALIGAKRATIPARDAAEKMKTAQLWAKLRTNNPNSNEVYWVKCELRRRGYNV